MATKIKLEVNHGKHVKQQSGQKITVPADKNTKQNKEKQQPKQIKNKPQKQQQKKVTQKNTNQPKKKQQPKTDKQKKQNKQDKKNEKEPPKKQTKSPQKQNKADKEMETIQRVKNTQLKTKVTIQELIKQYWDAADDIFQNHGHNEQKQKIIGQRLQKLKNQKQRRRKRLSELQQRSLNRSMIKQRKEDQKQELTQQKRKQKRRRKAEKKLQMLRQLSQQREQRQRKYKDYLNNQYKSKVFGFQKLQREYSQRQKKYEQQVKQKLAKNKKKYLPMNPMQIQDFAQQYQHQKWNMLQQSEKKRQQQNQLIEQQNKRLKEKLWRGQCHRRVKQQQRLKNRQQNQFSTRLKKTEEYVTLVKDQFQPRIDKKKRNQSLIVSTAISTNPFEEKTEVIDGQSYKKVARQKYQNGVNKGLVVQNLRKPLQHLDKVKKGNQYLQFLRSLPKVKKSPQQTHPQTEQPPNPQVPHRKKTPSTTFKPKLLKNPYYQNQSSKTERIISKSAALDEKRIKDPQLFHYVMADMRARAREMDLEEKAIRHGRYNGVLELQDRHNNLNRKLIKGISQKLNMLSKM